MNSDRIATLEIYRREDGTYFLHHIRWTGKATDGYWNDTETDQETVDKLLKLTKHPMPKVCGECDYCMNIPFQICLLDFTKDDCIDTRKDPVPDWCPLRNE